MTTPLNHGAVALALSYGLSLYFWFALGTFNLIGFIVVSACVALMGALCGWFLNKNIWITAIATIILRLAIYWLMTSLN